MALTEVADLEYPVEGTAARIKEGGSHPATSTYMHKALGF
jgi:hypothetical protein